MWRFSSISKKAKDLEYKDFSLACICVNKYIVCEIVRAPTNHPVNGAEEHGALGGRGALHKVLQHQWAMAEYIYKFPKVEHPHLLQVLPLLVGGGRTDRRKDGKSETQRRNHKEEWRT